jgi:hypothetical protein
MTFPVPFPNPGRVSILAAKKSAQLLPVALNRDLAPFSISLSWAGRMPTSQENPLFVEQVFCLFLRMMPDVWLN